MYLGLLFVYSVLFALTIIQWPPRKTPTKWPNESPNLFWLGKRKVLQMAKEKRKKRKQQQKKESEKHNPQSFRKKSNLKTVILNGNGLSLYVFMWNSLWQTGAWKFGSGSKSGMLLGKKNKSFVWFLIFPMLPFGDSVHVSKYNYVRDFKGDSAHVRAQVCTN